MTTAALHGRCLCGAVVVTLTAAPGSLVYCHCGQCRKLAGAPFQAVLPFPAGHVHITDADGCLRAFEASPGKQRWFCGRCGSPVMSRRDGSDSVRIRAGILDALPADIAREGHIFCADSAAWDIIDDDLPRYPGYEPGRGQGEGKERGS